jgi:hypothetical protein
MWVGFGMRTGDIRREADREIMMTLREDDLRSRAKAGIKFAGAADQRTLSANLIGKLGKRNDQTNIAAKNPRGGSRTTQNSGCKMTGVGWRRFRTYRRLARLGTGAKTARERQSPSGLARLENRGSARSPEGISEADRQLIARA